ncbi:MAG: dihydrodipicolinate synthase family protein [Chloroflexi bacterium]|nr:MAG: dihydrodipicolinate synthase family protein [Chloroflexota bacterium]TMF77909.1 MAG: dihydrodipicolinate synthase family protein [Chloroflexota bacterium]
MFKLDGLSGVLVALASPLKKDGAVDEAGVTRLVEHVLAGGVHGLLPLGSTGETAALDAPARRQILGTVIKSAGGRVPVICGVAQSRLSSARAEVEAAASQGADAALVAPPFYYPMDQDGVLAFYRDIGDRAPVPILVYNIPQFTKVVVEPATVATLAREGAIAGIKDSSRDFEYFEGICLATRDVAGFRVFTGSDTMLLASLAVGGAGTICGAGNIAPRWVVRIYDDFMGGHLEAARVSQDALYEVVMALRGGVFPSAIKAALHLQGICEPWPAPPAMRLDERREARLRERLAEWGLLTPERSRH